MSRPPLLCFFCHQICNRHTGFMTVRPAFFNDTVSDQRIQYHIHPKCNDKYYEGYLDMQEKPQIPLSNGLKVIL